MTSKTPLRAHCLSNPYMLLDRLQSHLMSVGAFVCVLCVCNALIASIWLQLIISAPSIDLYQIWNVSDTLTVPFTARMELFSAACAATDVHSNKIFSFVNTRGCNFSLIFTKFGTLLAEVIFKAEFICDRKQKYLARLCSNWISMFFVLYAVFHI